MTEHDIEPSTSAWRRDRAVGFVVAGLLVAAAVIIGIVLIGGDDASAPAPTEPVTTEPDAIAPSTTTDTTTDDTTTTAPPSTTTVPAVPDALELAVWPWPDAGLRFDDPVDAARSFAEDFVGFTEPLVGQFAAGDARSGEVEVRSGETFAPTTVLLRQLADDDSWWVIGSGTPNIVVNQPEVGAVVGNPLELSGTSVAWEGTVQVAIRADGDEDPIHEDFFTGPGAPDDPGPFETTLEWTPPELGLGALVLYTTSSDDGRILEATVVRVRFPEPRPRSPDG